MLHIYYIQGGVTFKRALLFSVYMYISMHFGGGGSSLPRNLREYYAVTQWLDDVCEWTAAGVAVVAVDRGA